MRRVTLSVAVIGGCVLGLSAPGEANFAYNLANVPFAEVGSTATGFVVADDALGTLKDFDIVTSTNLIPFGLTFTGYEYTPANTDASSFGPDGLTIQSDDGLRTLQLGFGGPLTPTGVAAISPLSSSEVEVNAIGINEAASFIASTSVRDVTGGFLDPAAAVPEPRSWILMLMGGLLTPLGLHRRRRAGRKLGAATA